MRGLGFFVETRAWVRVAVLGSLGFAACGGSEQPDTGYGANQTVPATVTCAAFCKRSVDCGGHLCAENTGKDVYIEIFSAMQSECESSCSSTALSSRMTSADWTCFFKSSCRQVFDDDSCHAQANYHCQ